MEQLLLRTRAQVPTAPTLITIAHRAIVIQTLVLLEHEPKTTARLPADMAMANLYKLAHAEASLILMRTGAKFTYLNVRQ